MKKLADISAFESLQNQAHGMMVNLSVFNGYVPSDQEVKEFGQKAKEILARLKSDYKPYDEDDEFPMSASEVAWMELSAWVGQELAVLALDHIDPEYDALSELDEYYDKMAKGAVDALCADKDNEGFINKEDLEFEIRNIALARLANPIFIRSFWHGQKKES